MKGHVLTWTQMCKIAETMARGLAFLHDEIPATNSLVRVDLLVPVLSSKWGPAGFVQSLKSWGKNDVCVFRPAKMVFWAKVLQSLGISWQWSAGLKKGDLEDLKKKKKGKWYERNTIYLTSNPSPTWLRLVCQLLDVARVYILQIAHLHHLLRFFGSSFLLCWFVFTW